MAEILSRQPGVHEQHVRGAAGRRTGGQLLVAKPVTSPDSARATEPRKPEATLSCGVTPVERVSAKAQVSESECASEAKSPK